MEINLKNLIKTEKPHTLILGTAGSGKTYLVKRLIADISAETSDSIFICDPQDEYQSLVSELNGHTVRLSNFDPCLNPMDADIDFKNRLVCFDLSGVGHSSRTAAMLTVMESVWIRLSQSRAADKNAWYFFDEFYQILQNEYAMKYFAEKWKRFHNSCCVPVFTTQNTEDLLCSDEFQNVLENTDLTVMFKQARCCKDVLAEKLGIPGQLVVHVTNTSFGCGIVKFGEVTVPFTKIS